MISSSKSSNFFSSTKVDELWILALFCCNLWFSRASANLSCSFLSSLSKHFLHLPQSQAIIVTQPLAISPLAWRKPPLFPSWFGSSHDQLRHLPYNSVSVNSYTTFLHFPQYYFVSISTEISSSLSSTISSKLLSF